MFIYAVLLLILMLVVAVVVLILYLLRKDYLQDKELKKKGYLE
jgi:preprotein translocase subunit YajC